MDNLTKEQRRKNMQNIRSQDTRPELILRRGLRRSGFRFRRHPKTIAGKPDFVFDGVRLAVFVDSDFWHGRPEHFVMPKSNRNYWQKKIQSNKKRDTRVNKKLWRQGWHIIRIWESNIKQKSEKCAERVLKKLRKIETV